MFLDASAIVAIVGDEEDAGYLIAKIEMSKKTIYYSSLSVYEAVISLARKKRDEAHPPHLIDLAQKHIDAFLQTIGAREMAIGSSMHRIAVEAAVPMAAWSRIQRGSISGIATHTPAQRRTTFLFCSRTTTFHRRILKRPSLAACLVGRASPSDLL